MNYILVDSLNIMNKSRSTMGDDLPSTNELIDRLDLDKVEEIVRSKISESESEKFFTDGVTNVSLYHCENEPQNFDDEFLVNEETYANALIFNMREAVKQADEEKEEQELAQSIVQAEADQEWEKSQEALRAQEESMRDRLKLVYGESNKEFETYTYDFLVTQERPYNYFTDETLITIYDCEKCKDNWQIYLEEDYDKSVTQIDAASIGSSLDEEIDQKCWLCGADCKHMKMTAVYRLESEEDDD